MRTVVAAFCALCLGATAAGAYTYFGKNKVQYYKRDWYVIAGEHVDLYFYGAERALAERAIVLAEEGWDDLARRMAFEPRRRVPLVIYSSHGEFEETNILPYLLPEGVGGFTELFKNRVVVPFEGSYPRFRRVIRHEMTHYFMYEELRDVYRRHNRFDYGAPPFWFTEGLAEYMSGEWDATSDMVLADALYNGALVPLTKARDIAGTYLAYKEGEAALRYLAATYGEDKVLKIITYAWLSRKYRDVLDLALPVTFAAFDEEWQRSLRKRYWPRYAERPELAAVATELSSGRAMRSGVAWLDRRRLVYLADEDGLANIYMLTLDDQGDVAAKRTLVRGEKSAPYSVLHVYRERLGTYGGRLVAFAARAGARDRIYVYDVRRDRVVESYEFEDLILLGSPSFSPDGAEIAFRGLTRAGQADLYVVNRASGEKRALCQDLADDNYPLWIEGGIIFASGRDAGAYRDYYNLYRLAPATGKIERLTAGPWRDLYPTQADDGSIYFTSDRGGSFDLYRLEPDGRLSRMTKSLSGVVEAAPRPGGDAGDVALVGFADQSFNLYAATLSPTGEVPPQTPPPPAAERPRSLALASFPVKGYRTTFSLDYFSAQVAYGPEFGTQTGLVISFTDLLNDQNIVAQFGNDAESLDDFLARTSVGVDYYNLHHRVGYGVGAFHYVSDYFDYQYGLAGRDYTETRAGAGATLNYPLDRFHRVGVSLYGYELKREWEIGSPPEYGTKVAPYVSASRDTSLWYQDGPLDGQRLAATVGVTEDVRRRRADYVYILADLRHYLRTTRRQCLAMRAVALGTFGPDARPLYAGGSLSMRGYNYFDFRGRRFAMVNVEYRFPVLESFPLRTALGTAPTPPVRGALFFDVGEGWDDVFGQPRGGFGLSLRAMLWGVLTLRTDHTVLTDFASLGPLVPVKFFVGWSY